MVSNLDIEALSRAISALTEEVRSIKNSQATSNLRGKSQVEETSPQASVPRAESRRNNISLTPEPEAGYRRRARTLLEDMDEDQYKLFHVSIE